MANPEEMTDRQLAQLVGQREARWAAQRSQRESTPMSQDEELIERLRARYTAEPVPPCPVCGEPLSIQAGGGGSITWGCIKRDDGKSPLDDHYDRSRWEQRRLGDDDVLAVLDRLAALAASPSPVVGDREAIGRIVKGARLSAAFGREFRAGDGRLDDVDLDAADAILSLSTPVVGGISKT